MLTELRLDALFPLANWNIPNATSSEDTFRMSSLYQPLITRLLELPRGSMVVLLGDLGAGKTTLISLLLAALESEARVSSPSYTLIHEYPSPQGTVVHVDAYKFLPAEATPLSLAPVTSQALLELGLEDYLEYARLLLVEWGASLIPTFPEAYVLTFHLTPQQRRIHLYACFEPQPTTPSPQSEQLRKPVIS